MAKRKHIVFIRYVKTQREAIANQSAYKKRRIVKIVHIGIAHNEKELNILLALARNRLRNKQMRLFAETPSIMRIQYKDIFPRFVGALILGKS